MKSKKKWLYWIGAIILFLLLLNLGINIWIQHSLPKIIKEKNDTAYNFEYDKLGFSLFNSSVNVQNVKIQPKEINSNKKPKLDFTAQVEEISVVGVNFIKLLTKKDLSAYSIKIKKPKIVYFQPEIKDTAKSNSKLGSAIHVSNFEIQKAEFKMMDADRKTEISHVQYADVEINGVDLSQRTIEKNIPFTYSEFDIFTSEIFYQINPSQILKANSLKVNNKLFVLNNFTIQSAGDVENLNQNKLSYRLLPDIKTPKVFFTGLDWRFDKKDDFYFKADILKFDSVDIHIKNTTESTRPKNDSLGNLIPFKLNIDKIMVGQSRLRVKNSLDAKNINILIEKIENEVGQKLTVQNLFLKHPDITTFTRNQETKKIAQQTTGFIDTIRIKKFQIDDATYNLKNSGNQNNLLKVSHVDFTTQDIEMNPSTFYEKIPVTYKNAKFTASSVVYNPNSVYSLKTNKISFDNGNFKLNDFEMKPKISRAAFVRQLKQEKDLYTITAKTVAINQIDFGFQGNDLYFKTPYIAIQNADANIFRSKLPADDPKKKELYSKLLRDLPIILEVKKLDLKNSKIEYEEETESSKGAGKLTFSNFNASIHNIYSGRQKSSVPNLIADIKTNFMNDSKLNAVWVFNPMNRAEKFNIKGNIYSFNAAKMTPFIKPYLHVSAEGDIQEVQFDFNGNDNNANGTFGIKYKDLKVKVFDDENKKEKKLITAVGNLLVKTKTNDDFKKVDIKTVERNQQRSFYNFFWHCVQQGLKQTLLII